MALLKCDNLTLGYSGKPVATGISFTVNAGDYLCIIGENGSGKTTLMKALLNLKPQISGSITTGDGLKQNEIGYLPQRTDIQRDFPASVTEVALSGCLNRRGIRPYYSKEEKQQAKENMAKLGIPDIKNRCFRELSGGQQQRVMLARALGATKKLLLLDEPTAGLDPEISNGMYELIKNLHKSGTTIISITHDIAAAMRYATHILQIKEQPFYGTITEYSQCRS